MNRREHLQKLILRRLLLYGRATRPELVALTGRRAATVFEAIDALKAASLVIEPERRGKKTGRRAPELECNRNCGCFLGIELRADAVIGVVTDSCGDTLEQYETRLDPTRLTPEYLRGEIGKSIAELRQRIGDKWELMRGVGFAAPEADDLPECGTVVSGEWLTNECALPVGVWPRRMAKTRMEYISRLPDAPESLFHLDTDGGIGGGFIKCGRIFVGSSGHGMEIGHVVVDRNGPLCSCGSRGCLETVAGRRGILDMVRAELRRGADTELDGKDLSIRRLVECSHRDQTARMIATRVSESIGSALATVVTLLNPSLIVLSGELTGLGDLLLETVRETIADCCLSGAVRKLKLEISALESGDTARGVAMMIRDRVWGIDGWRTWEGDDPGVSI